VSTNGRTGARGLRRLLGAASAGTALVAMAGAWPAQAAQVATSIAAPYGTAHHDTYMSCPSPNIAPNCSASAAMDPRSGRIDVTATIDSGAGGNIPGTASSEATGQLEPVFNMGDATAATFTATFHVLRAGLTTDNLGRAYVLLGATAACDGCPLASGGWAAADRPGDQRVSVTLVRGRTGGRMATIDLGASAITSDYCDDFCLTPPSGTAKASAQVVVTGVEVRLWGVGKPATPVITAPGSGSTLNRSPDGTGQQVSGTAEPGMPVQILDGSNVVADTQADDTGQWYASVDLRPGRHALAAEASGPQASTTSPRSSVNVTA
jgi:hypothetical protein